MSEGADVIHICSVCGFPGEVRELQHVNEGEKPFPSVVTVGWYVRCFNCGRMGPAMETRQEAIDAWNGGEVVFEGYLSMVGGVPDEDD